MPMTEITVCFVGGPKHGQYATIPEAWLGAMQVPVQTPKDRMQLARYDGFPPNEKAAFRPHAVYRCMPVYNGRKVLPIVPMVLNGMDRDLALKQYMRLGMRPHRGGASRERATNGTPTHVLMRLASFMEGVQMGMSIGRNPATSKN